MLEAHEWRFDLLELLARNVIQESFLSVLTNVHREDRIAFLLFESFSIDD